MINIFLQGNPINMLKINIVAAFIVLFNYFWSLKRIPAMRILISLLIVLACSSAFAQSTESLRAKLLMLDTTIDLAPSFNAKLIQYAPGYRFLGSEKKPGERIIYTYSDGHDGVIRLEYKYE